MRWAIGRSIFKCFGDKVATFLQYSYSGSEFVFGNFLVKVDGAFTFSVGFTEKKIHK